MMYRIVLVELNEGLWNPGLFCRHSAVEPLGIEYIGAAVKNEGHKVKIIQQRDRKDAEVLQEIIGFNPDIVGFSVMTYNFNASLRMAKEIKEKNPKISIIFGGYHPTAKPEIVIDENIDFVIVGEGEYTFIDLLKNLENQNNFSTLNGIAYYDGTLHVNKKRERCKDLDNLPFPLRDKTILESCKIESLIYPPSSEQKCVALMSFSRGCPFNCTFCCSPNLWGEKVKFRSPQNVVAEIKNLQRMYDTNLIFFVDLNFNTSKTKIYELCNELTRAKIEINWYVMCRPDNIDKDLITTMASAGCSKIAFGVDALNAKTLQRIKPKQKVNENTIRDALEITYHSPIFVRGFLIIGYPWETKRDLYVIKEQIKTLPIEDLRIGILTPLPGSVMYEEFKREGLLLHEDFSKYTTEECVIKLKDMTPEELYEIREQIFREFYQSKEYKQRMKEKIKKYPHLKQSYDEFLEFLTRKGIYWNKLIVNDISNNSTMNSLTF